VVQRPRQRKNSPPAVYRNPISGWLPRQGVAGESPVESHEPEILHRTLGQQETVERIAGGGGMTFADIENSNILGAEVTRQLFKREQWINRPKSSYR
jgi:hypothetical protein